MEIQGRRCQFGFAAAYSADNPPPTFPSFLERFLHSAVRFAAPRC